MEDIRTGSVVSFDTQYTTNHISMFKVLLHALAPSLRTRLAVWIKFMELQYTLQLAGNSVSGSSHSAQPSFSYTSSPPGESASNSFTFTHVFEELLPYCSAGEKEQFTQIHNLLQTMQNLQNMLEMMETLKELFPEGMSPGDGQGGFSPEMFTAMSSMFGGSDMDFSQFSQMKDLFSGE